MIDLPGVPKGYEAVRVGKPEAGEYYINGNGDVSRRAAKCFAGGYVIVRKIEPETETVTLHEYVCWDNDAPTSRFLRIATSADTSELVWDNIVPTGITMERVIEVPNE